MIHLFTAILMLVLGYLVKYKKWSWMIAGYNTSSRAEKNQYDQDAICNGVGNFLFILAGILIIPFIGELTQNNRLVTAGWVIFVIATVIFLIYANTGNRFKKNN